MLPACLILTILCSLWWLQLKKQAEITAAQQAALEAKERAEAERKAKRQAELAEVGQTQQQ